MKQIEREIKGNVEEKHERELTRGFIYALFPCIGNEETKLFRWTEKRAYENTNSCLKYKKKQDDTY